MNINKIICGDSRHEMAHLTELVDLIITSPPYADARKKQYESISPDHFAEWLMSFSEVFWNALKPDGSLVINIKDKVVNGVRHRYVWEAMRQLTAAGWLAIDDYIWHKTTAMPGYWPSRLRDGWEYCFHLAKSKRPYMDQAAVRVPIGQWASKRLKALSETDKSRQNSATNSGFGRNLSRWRQKESVLPSNVLQFAPVTRNTGHPASFPIELPAFFIKLLSRQGGFVVDPFCGVGNTGVAALSLERSFLLIDISEKYTNIAHNRIFNKIC